MWIAAAAFAASAAGAVAQAQSPYGIGPRCDNGRDRRLEYRYRPGWQAAFRRHRQRQPWTRGVRAAMRGLPRR